MSKKIIGLIALVFINIATFCQISPEKFIKNWAKSWSNFPSDINNDEQYMMQYYSENLLYVIDTIIGSNLNIEQLFVNELDYWKLNKSNYSKLVKIEKIYKTQQHGLYTVIICNISIKYNKKLSRIDLKNKLHTEDIIYRCTFTLSSINKSYKICHFHFTILKHLPPPPVKTNKSS